MSRLACSELISLRIRPRIRLNTRLRIRLMERQTASRRSFVDFGILTENAGDL